MAIDWIAARLNDEDIRTAHVFENLKINFSVTKAIKLGFTQRNFQMPADTLRKRQIGGARENFKAVVVQERLLQIFLMKKGLA
jgi:hypothetical protein